jgi:hypothetical protein
LSQAEAWWNRLSGPKQRAGKEVRQESGVVRPTGQRDGGGGEDKEQVLIFNC